MCHLPVTQIHKVCIATSILTQLPTYLYARMPKPRPSIRQLTPGQFQHLWTKCQYQYANVKIYPNFLEQLKNGQTTAAYGYTNLENLQRLQKSLKGKAKKFVGALLKHPNSVNAIISTLELYFGRPEILIKSQLAKVRALPKINDFRNNEIVMIPYLTVFFCATH